MKACVPISLVLLSCRDVVRHQSDMKFPADRQAIVALVEAQHGLGAEVPADVKWPARVTWQELRVGGGRAAVAYAEELCLGNTPRRAFYAWFMLDSEPEHWCELFMLDVIAEPDAELILSVEDDSRIVVSAVSDAGGEPRRLLAVSTTRGQR